MRNPSYRTGAISAIGLALALVVATPLAGQATADQTATIEVAAVQEISVSNATPSLTVNTATAGAEPDAATDVGTYSITVNNTTSKIAGALDANAPTNTLLEANLVAVGGGTSTGLTELSTTSADLVTGIGPAAATASLTLSFSATVDAGIVASATRTVTYTVSTTTP